MNIILIGPVSDNVERAKRVFALAEKLLTEAGHTVVHNPMRDHVPGLTEAQYMQKSLTAICEASDRYRYLIACNMPGAFSLGCAIENTLCQKLGMQRDRIINPSIYEKLYKEHNRK